MSCRAAINRDIEFRLAHVALSALRNRKYCDECACWTNHDTAAHLAAVRDDDVSDEDAVEPEEEC